MSILSQAVSLTTMPGPVTPSADPTDSALLLPGVLAWAAVGLLVAYAFNAFRRPSIVGPERLLPTDSAWDLLIVLFVAFLMSIISAGAFSHIHLQDDVKILALNGVANAGSCLAIIIVLIAIRPGQLIRLGTNPRWIPAGIAGGAATLFVLYPLIFLTGAVVESAYRILHASQPSPHELLQLLGHSHNRGLTIATIALAVVSAPLAEELMYRGLLQTVLVRTFVRLSNPINVRDIATPISAPPAGEAQRWAGVVLTAIIFAAIHMNLAFFFPIFVLALGLGYIYERTGNLWITMFAHGLFNGGQILYFVANGH